MECTLYRILRVEDFTLKIAIIISFIYHLFNAEIVWKIHCLHSVSRIFSILGLESDVKLQLLEVNFIILRTIHLMELATFKRISCILVALLRIRIHIGFVLVEISLKGKQHFVLDAYDPYA